MEPGYKPMTLCPELNIMYKISISIYILLPYSVTILYGGGSCEYEKV